MLASEQQIRPDLTLEKLKLELTRSPAVKSIFLPLLKSGVPMAKLARAGHTRLLLCTLT